MTIANTPRKAGPFDGNGVTDTFPFAFKVFAASNLFVVLSDSDGVETTQTLTTHYTVTLNSDQDDDPGGDVVMVTAPAAGETLTLSSALPIEQPTELTNAGGFYPSVINDALDRITIVQQQEAEKLSRALKTSISSPLTESDLPTPIPSYIIGWNAEGTGFENYGPVDNTLLSAELEASGGSSLIGYMPAGTGAVASKVQTKQRESVSVEDFGATGDGVADDTAEIQAAIDAVFALGGGDVLFSKALYLSQKLTLPSNVILKGKGSAFTTIKLKNSSNTSLIETEDFSTLTGSNSWFVDTEGVPYGFGIVGMTLDGNKANQTAGNCVNVYGKRYLVSDVVVKDAYGVGWYTECAYKGGQHDWRDMPEGRIDGLYIHLSGSHGLQVRGPHDLFITSAFVSQSQGDGVRVEGLLDVYQGNSDIGLIHSYGNVGMGFYCNTLVNADVIIGETNAKEGVVFDAGSGISTCSVIRAFGNDYNETGTYYNVRLATGIQVGTIHCMDNTYQSAGGINLAGNQIQIGTLNVISTIAHEGKGIYSPGATNVDIGSAIVEGYSGATGEGVSITSMTRCSIDAFVTNCKTLYAIAAVGNGNTFTFRGLSGAGQTQYSGTSSFIGTNSVRQLFSDGSVTTSKEWLPNNTILYPPATSTPAENGEMTFELTSATELKIKVKSGGTIREASIALS